MSVGGKPGLSISANKDVGDNELKTRPLVKIDRHKDGQTITYSQGSLGIFDEF